MEKASGEREVTEDDDTVELKCPKDRVIVEPDPFPWEYGSLVLPGAYAERPEYRKWYGTVVEVGPGAIDPETGRRIPVDLEIGDRVLYDRNASEPVGGGYTSIRASAVYLKGDDVTRFTQAATPGIREDGTRINEDLRPKRVLPHPRQT